MISFSEQLSRHPEYRNIDTWDEIDTFGLTKAIRTKYLRDKHMVGEALRTNDMKGVAKQYNVSVGTIYYKLKRCLSSKEGQVPALSKGLIPHTRLKKPERHAPLSTHSYKRGNVCSLQYTLDHVDGLQDKLDRKLLADIKDNSHGENLTVKTFFQAYIQYLQDAGWPEFMWPFTQLDRGKESVRKYYHQRRAVFNRIKANHYVPHRKLPVANMFEQIQIDEQVFDARAKIYLNVGGIIFPLAISRCVLVLAIDVATTLIVSYKLVLRGAANQDDLLDVLEGLGSITIERQITTPGLTLEPYPPWSSTSEELFKYLQIGSVSLDNAWMHHAHSVTKAVTHTLAASLYYGAPKRPKLRHFVEYAYKRINEDNSHRVKSTTGSHVRDPKRESTKNAKKVPVVTLTALEDMLAIVIADHNVQSRQNLLSLSPLRYADLILQSQYHPFNQFQPESLRSIDTHQRHKVLTVSKVEKRPAYIYALGIKYTARSLSLDLYQTINVIIKYPKHDLRIIKAYRESGDYIGEFWAPTCWQQFPHGKATRKFILDLIKQGKIKRKDVLLGYFDYLMEDKELPTNALEIGRLYQEYGIDKFFKRKHSNCAQKKSHVPPKVMSKENPYAWKVEQANQRSS